MFEDESATILFFKKRKSDFALHMCLCFIFGFKIPRGEKNTALALRASPLKVGSLPKPFCPTNIYPWRAHMIQSCGHKYQGVNSSFPKMPWVMLH